MTTDFAEMLEDIDKRLYRLEQLTTSVSVMGTTNEFSELILTDDGIGEDVFLAITPPDVPQNVSVTTGTFFDSSFADVEWDAPADVSIPAASYSVELAEKQPDETYLLEKIQTAISRSTRFEGLVPGITYGVRVTAVSPIGRVSPPTAWTDFTAEADQTIPAAPATISVYRGSTSVVVTFPEVADADVARGNGLYEVQVDTSSAFNTGNLQTNRASATIVAFDGINGQQTWFGRVRAIDTSGNVSPWTESGGVTAGGVVDNMVISGLNAAKITFGSMSGDRITANTLDVNKIVTSTLVSTTITLGVGGVLRIGSPPTNGIFINDQGITAYNGGSEKFRLTSSGVATFAGNVNGATITGSSMTSGSLSSVTITGATITGGIVRTASSGARMELDSFVAGGILRMYSNSSQSGSISTLNDGSAAVVSIAGVSGWSNTPFVRIRSGSNVGDNYFWFHTPNLIRLTCDWGGGNGTFWVDAGGNGGVLIPTLYHDSSVGGRDLAVTSAGWVGYASTSTLRMKRDVETLDKDGHILNLSRKILDLPMVSFKYRGEKSEPGSHFGMIAEWVHEQLGEDAKWFVRYDEEGRPDGLDYDMLALAMLPVVKKLSDDYYKKEK